MIENIEELSEFQRLLKDNPELSNLKDFFTYRIEKILSEKLDDSINKDFIEKQDFDLFEKDLEKILWI